MIQVWVLYLFFKKSPAKMFSCEFCKVFANLFFYRTRPDKCFWIFLFISLFFATRWTNRNQFFSIFVHVLSQFSNVMNIMNLNDLVAAAREETFLGDITWNIAVFCRLISISICIYWISVFHCPAIIHPWNTYTSN